MERTEPLWTKESTYGLKLYKWITWPIGTWPFDCENIFSTFRFVFFILTQISFVISLISEVFQDCISVNEKIDYIGNLSCAFMCIVKMVSIRLNRNKLMLVISSAMKDWSSDENVNFQKIMRSYAHTGRFLFIGQMSFVILVVWVMVLGNIPLLLSDDSEFENISRPLNPLPLPTDCFYKNMTKTTNIVVYVIQSLQLFSTTLGYCGTDVVFFGVAMHICGQLEILKNRMSNFGNSREKIPIRGDLLILIKRHNHLISMSRLLKDCYSGILIIQLFLNCLIIVMLGVQIILTIKTVNPVLLSRCVLALIVLLVQFFIYCYAGDYLTTLNEILLDAIYSSPWYNFPISVSKDLIFMMMRTKVKFHITAGKFCKMDMESFKNIVKASLSYISVLMVMLKLNE